MNMYRLFVLFIFTFSKCEERAVDKSVIQMLTNDSSKVWELYEHNYTEDNANFVKHPPYFFLEWFGVNYLVLKIDNTFQVGIDGQVGYDQRDWVLGNSQDSIKLIETTFYISTLTTDNLFIRQKIGDQETKTLPYYEYRFKRKE